MSAPAAAAVEYGQVIGYALIVCPPPAHPFPAGADVYETVEEARTARNYINAGGHSTIQVEIVELRRVIVE